MNSDRRNIFIISFNHFNWDRHIQIIFWLKVWKEQIQKAKDLYEEAKVASASQIDRFYLSYCGGGNPIANQGITNERMTNPSVMTSSELELDSEHVRNSLS